MTAHSTLVSPQLFIASTWLAAHIDHALPVFRHMAEQWELSVTEPNETLQIELESGVVIVAQQGDGTSVRIEGFDASGLQMIRDLLTSQFILHDLNPIWDGEFSGQRPGNQSLATVADVQRISSSYTRITVEGADLARFASGGLHFRLLFGPKGAPWPTTDTNGVTVWPGGATAWHRPVYTVRRITKHGLQHRLEFDVFLHDGGRVTTWTQTAKMGDEIALVGPGGDAKPKLADWMGFVGDETALPALARMLADLPTSTQGEAVIFVPKEDDIQPMPHPAGVKLRWELRDTGHTMIDALTSLVIPQVARRVFFAGELQEAQAARQVLLDRGLSKREFMAATYWTRDKDQNRTLSD